MSLPYDAFPLSIVAQSLPTFQSLALNTTTRIVAGFFVVNEDITVDRLGYTLLSITGTSPTQRISIQGIAYVGAVANPDGTVLGGASPASATFNPTSLGHAANSHNTIVLDNSIALTRGQKIAVVLEYSSGTVDASNCITPYYYTTMPDLGLPYPVDYQASWLERTGAPLFSFGNSTTTYGYPFAQATQQSYTSAGTNEYGFVFNLPTANGVTYELYGVRILYSPPGASGTYAAKVYQGDGAADTTVLQSNTGLVGALSGTTNRVHTILFSGTLATLSFGSPYRFSLLAETANTNTLYYLNFTTAGHQLSMSQAVAAYWTSRAGGNWTDVTTRMAIVELLIGNITLPSGGTTNVLTQRNRQTSNRLYHRVRSNQTAIHSPSNSIITSRRVVR